MAHSPLVKTQLHVRNLHKSHYDFPELAEHLPELKAFILKSKSGQLSIDFTDAKAVKSLNKALLKTYYHVADWDIPEGYLCPPIPGRVDYIHYLADLLSNTYQQLKHQSAKVKVLDIGTGASCIYPLLGNKTYKWQFVATDIDPVSVNFAKRNTDKISTNESNINQQVIACRLQKNSKNIFKNIIHEDELFALTMCNPPFHQSLEQATAGTERKWKNLGHHKSQTEKSLNFGGQKAELWCPGGEVAFISTMIKESKHFAKQVLWFTCLVSKKDNIKKIKFLLKKTNAKEVQIINMAQGQKNSRFIAWTFLNNEEQVLWSKQYLLKMNLDTDNE